MSFHRDRRVCDRCGLTAPSGSNVHAPGWFYAHLDWPGGLTFHLCAGCYPGVPKIVADVRSASGELWGILAVEGKS
jgi:hypothetical protein